MSLILNLETSGPKCSVSLAENGVVLCSKEENTINTHASMLTVLIQQALAEANKTMQDLDAVAISNGPGSYTGLRIGASTAKGLCYALNKPLIKISTLQILASKYIKSAVLAPEKKIMPIIQAKKDAFYFSLYDSDLNPLQEERSFVFSDNKQELEQLFECKLLVLNETSQAIIDKLLKFGIGFVTIKINAKEMADISNALFFEQSFENIVSYEPYYLSGFGNKF